MCLANIKEFPEITIREMIQNRNTTHASCWAEVTLCNKNGQRKSGLANKRFYKEKLVGGHLRLEEFKGMLSGDLRLPVAGPSPLTFKAEDKASLKATSQPQMQYAATVKSERMIRQ